MAYAIAWQDHSVYVRYSDRVTFAEFMVVILGIHADANYASLRYVIHDMLGATELDFSNLDMTGMVAQELGARYTNRSVRPAVVSSDPRMEASTLTFSSLTKLDVGFFSTIAAALAWATAAPVV